MTFSERYGYAEARSTIQIESIDETTRIALWNTIKRWVVSPGMPTGYTAPTSQQQALNALLEAVWEDLFEADLDNYEFHHSIATLKHTIRYGYWNEVYDAVEFLSQDSRTKFLFSDFDLIVNTGVLERYMCGYRIVNSQVIPVSDKMEVEEIELAANVPYAGAKDAIRRAIDDLSNRDNPDFADAVAQSISAVESIAGEISGKHTLGDSLKELKKTYGFHPALADGWAKIYGFTSDESGIRHGGSEAAAVSADLARYLLVTCSAMVNLLASLDSHK